MDGQAFAGRLLKAIRSFRRQPLGFSRMDDAFLSEVQKKGDYIREKLTAAGYAVSGMGLMVGITTAKPVGEVIAACIENGVLCLSAKDKLRLLPPLNTTWDQLEKAIDVIIGALNE